LELGLIDEKCNIFMNEIVVEERIEERRSKTLPSFHLENELIM
jgi:hypothetical protein